MIYLNILYIFDSIVFKLLIHFISITLMLNLAIVEIATNITLNEFVFFLFLSIDNVYF